MAYQNFNQPLNQHISEVFDNIMSDNNQPPMTTSLSSLRMQASKEIQDDFNQAQPQQKQLPTPQPQPQQPQQQNQSKEAIISQIPINQIEVIQQKLIIPNKQRSLNKKKYNKQNITLGRKNKTDKLDKPNKVNKSNKLDKPNKPNKPNKLDTEKNISNNGNKRELYDISKKALIGAAIYMILSSPPFQCLFNMCLTNNTMISEYKNIFLKGMLFSIIFVLVASYLK